MKRILFFLVFLSVILISRHPIYVEGCSENIHVDDYIHPLIDLSNIVSETDTIIKHNDHDNENDDLYWLSRVVSAESKGECEEGQIAVANVVLNRVASGQFPNKIKDVIFQPNQFSTVSNGMIHDTPSNQAVRSAKMALEGKKTINDGVLYFYNPRYVSKDNWIRTREVHTQIGSHIFAY